MKKVICSIVCLLFVFSGAVYSQESDEKSVLQNEISVSTSRLTFDDLSLKYARLISNDLWFKVGVINLDGSFHKNMPQVGSFNSTTSSLNGGLVIGIEKQKSINRLEFNYGLNVQMIYNHTNFTTENPNVPLIQRDINAYSYNPGIGFGLGFFYKFNPSILLGFEINPTMNYVFINGKSTSTGYAFKNRDFYFSFTNNGALITLKYKF